MSRHTLIIASALIAIFVLGSIYAISEARRTVSLPQGTNEAAPITLSVTADRTVLPLSLTTVSADGGLTVGEELESATITITVRNNTPTPLDGLVLDITGPDGAALVVGFPENPDQGAGDNAWLWDIGTLAVGEAGELTLTIAVTAIEEPAFSVAVAALQGDTVLDRATSPTISIQRR